MLGMLLLFLSLKAEQLSTFKVANHL